MQRDRLKQACAEFAKRTGVAVLEGEEDISVGRWLLAGALTLAQQTLLSDIYEEFSKCEEGIR